MKKPKVILERGAEDYYIKSITGDVTVQTFKGHTHRVGEFIKEDVAKQLNADITVIAKAASR